MGLRGDGVGGLRMGCVDQGVVGVGVYRVVFIDGIR